MQKQKVSSTMSLTIPFAPKDEFITIDKAIGDAAEYARRNLGIMMSSMSLSLETLSIGLTIEHGTIKVLVVEGYSNEEADE